MYGANAPKLTRLIIEELRRENEKIAGTPRPDEREITDLAEEEQVRASIETAKIEAALRIEEQKKAQQLLERRTEQAKCILETYGHIGTILILPRGKLYYNEIMTDLWPVHGLVAHSKEKIRLNPAMLQEILYFADGFTFPEHVEEELFTEDSFALFIKPGNDDVSGIIDEVVLELVYGPSKQHPGSPKSVAQLLVQKVEDVIKQKEEEEAAKRAEQEETEEEKLVPSEEGRILYLVIYNSVLLYLFFVLEPKEIICIWAPPNSYTKAYAFKNFFPKVAGPLIMPEPEPTPPHLAVAYDAFKRREILALMEQYPQAVLRYGFFTSDEPGEAQLIAKNPQNFERKLAEAPT